MRKYSLIFLLYGAVLSAQAQFKVVVEVPNVDLTTYETFTVVKGEVITPEDEQKVNEEELFQKMKNAIATELEAKGYKYVNDSTAQLIVSYVTGSFKQTNSENLGPLGSSPAATPADVDQSRSWSRDFREGILEIEVSSRTRRELWKVSGTLTTDTSDPKIIDGSVYKALRKFPNRNRKRR
ncbi:MAG TPA: DUF4136 domain-containing protein [Ohtaekwangia sp.]|uniref:DUF4136 domain-containing protein n=1 Tax=Ohtaekwangia sp. TaxID=2066019 RepID=UPI002F9229D9